MIRMIKNNRAQTGTTLTSVLGILIIFILMFVLVVGVLFIAGDRKLDPWNSGKTTKEGKIKNDLVLMENLIYFLNTRMENGETLYELISKADIPEGKAERESIFKREAEKFMLEYFPTGGFFEINWARNWMRVYDYNEEIGQIGYDWIYDVSEGYRSNGPCDPYRADAVFVTLFVIPDKKIAVCANMEK